MRHSGRSGLEHRERVQGGPRCGRPPGWISCRAPQWRSQERARCPDRAVTDSAHSTRTCLGTSLFSCPLQPEGLAPA